MILGGVALILALLIWLLTKDTITAVSIVIVALILGIMGSRKPQELEYELDQEGLYIAKKHYPFNTFKSFSIVHRGNISVLIFRPFRRFSLYVTAYYDLADEQKIMNILSRYLPIENGGSDVLDDLMWKLRF